MDLDIIPPKGIFVMSLNLSYTTDNSSNNFSVVHYYISISVRSVELKKFFYSVVPYANSYCPNEVSHKLRSTSSYGILYVLNLFVPCRYRSGLRKLGTLGVLKRLCSFLRSSTSSRRRGSEGMGKKLLHVPGQYMYSAMNSGGIYNRITFS